MGPTELAGNSLVVLLVTRGLPHPAPVGAAVNAIHAITAKAGDQDPQGLSFGNTPLRGPTISLFFRALVLLHAGDIFHVHAQQVDNGLKSHQARENGNNGSAAEPVERSCCA